MLQSIEIENFRCFHHSLFENFGQVNLIGGKNNSGKTALLEALLLGSIPTSLSIDLIERIRGERNLIFYEHPDLAWANLFYQQIKENKICLKINRTNNKDIIVELIRSEAAKPIDSKIDIKEDLNKIEDATPEKLVATLQIKSNGFTDSIKYEQIAEDPEKNLSLPPSISTQARLYKPDNNAVLISTITRRSSRFLSADFEKAKLQNQTDEILAAFQTVDDSIVKIDSINIGEPRIYIFRKEGPPQALNFFGDALKKIADLILRLINNKNAILLIDEIENGIHHTNQQDFWKFLIKLSIANNVQVFATTHSAEMVKAFHDAARKGNWQENVRYLELLRSKKSGEIIANHQGLDTLEYNLKNQNPFRGE